MKKIKNSKKVNEKTISASVNPTTEKKNKKVKASESIEVKASSKKKLLKKVTEKQGASLVENVISKREVKWKYPADINTPLARKSWRQKARHEINKLQSELYTMVNKGSVEYKKKEAELKEKREAYLKAAV